MADSFTQLHIQFVFAVKYRNGLINASWKERLHQYISAIVQNEKHKMLQINSMPDHIHLLVGLRPYQSISSLIQKVKTGSNDWINKTNLLSSKFAWQEGYGAFSYSRSHVENVINYIRNQEQHHKKTTFLDEYKSMLEASEIDYNLNHIFVEPE